MTDAEGFGAEPTAPLRVAGLHLAGVTKDYRVSFLDQHGEIRRLSIIAGEISTGKTSTLELIDYCLGSSNHPQHEEIVQSVRGVRLALEVRELTAQASAEPEPGSDDMQGARGTAEVTTARRRCVLERAIPGPSSLTFLFQGDLDRIENVPPRRLNLDPSSEDSVSQFLLTAMGLGGLRLRVAPSKPDSQTHVLSFRDVTPLYFLTHRRLDNGDLVLEHQPYRNLKLQQVVDYFFGVSDEARSVLAAQIEEVTKRRTEARAGIKALRAFLRDQGVAGEIALEAAMTEMKRELRQSEERLQDLDRQIEASTDFASDVRQRYDDGVRRHQSVLSELRERETLLARLSPLRSQYADDLRKMSMLIEARRLFDPLSVTVCPACQSTLQQPPTINDAVCSLCQSAVPHLVDAALAQRNGQHALPDVTDGLIEPGDLDAERRSVSSRLTELSAFMSQIEEETATLRAEARRRAEERSQFQHDLDAVTRDAITPFLAERDLRGREVARLQASFSEAQQGLRLLAGLEDREKEEERLTGSLESLRERLRDLNDENPTRDRILDSISQRFSAILADFGFPKLSGAYVNARLVPYARSLRYDQIGSSGAMTLLALAWQLAIFELSIEEGSGHPGFLMIDSPQKNLKAADQREWDAATADSIVDRVYRHIIGWLDSHGESAQIIVVDNAPPQWVSDHVVVRYSGRADDPPYGLIDDAIA